MMGSCHYRGCQRIPNVPVMFKFPQSKDRRLAQGGTIFFCEKHYETLKFMLDIKEVEDEA